MQSVSSEIWTRIAVSISCDDDHYTTGTSIKKAIIIVDIGCLMVYQLFVDNLMPKPSLQKNSSDIILPIAGAIKGVVSFLMVFVE